MNVYTYARVSTAAQAEKGISLDEQRHRIDSTALAQSWVITKRFIEADVSGSVPLGERPEGAKLLAVVAPGDIVVAAKLDRLFRSARDALNVIENFQRRDVSLWLLDIGGDVSGNGTAKLMLKIVSAFIEFQKDRSSERISGARRQMRAIGRSLAGNRRFGYRVNEAGKLVKVAEEQAAIAEMRQLRKRGRSYRQIADELQKRQQLKVSFMTVRRILGHEAAAARQ